MLSPSLACCASNSRSLATTSNSGDSSASRAHVVTVRRMSRSWIHSAGVGFSLYSLGADPTENTASSSFSIVIDSCLAIGRILFPRERVYRAIVQKRPFIYSPIAQQRLHSLSRGPCLATGLYTTIYVYIYIFLYIYIILLLIMPITVAARSKAWTAFARSNAGVLGSNPSQGMYICVCFYSVFVFSCV
jgi:hypothetical protein